VLRAELNRLMIDRVADLLACQCFRLRDACAQTGVIA